MGLVEETMQAWCDKQGQLDLQKIRAWEEEQRAKQQAASFGVQIIQEKLLSLQVCALEELTPVEVEAITNSIHFCGTTNGWKIDEQPSVICADDPTRRHWVLVC
jgi:hypothetical protein